MILLVSGATSDVREAPADRVGVLFCPGMRNAVTCLAGRTWAADNGAFGVFDAGAFVDMLGKLRASPVGCRFVAAPDVVGQAEETLALFEVWEPIIRSHGYPVALVAQDGLTVPCVPWDRIDALFIGGSTDWKLGRDAETLLAYAAARGKWRHVGRVNTRRRIRHFHGLCDSIDGSGFSRFPKRIGSALAWMEGCRTQPTLQTY